MSDDKKKPTNHVVHSGDWLSILFELVFVRFFQAVVWLLKRIARGFERCIGRSKDKDQGPSSEG